MMMPTVIVADGFAVRVNIVEDGEGPHVHVIKGGREYRVRLLRDGALLMTIGGYEKATGSEARRAVRIVEDHLNACWAEWNKWHA
jgi:hypothetical protein